MSYRVINFVLFASFPKVFYTEWQLYVVRDDNILFFEKNFNLQKDNICFLYVMIFCVCTLENKDGFGCRLVQYFFLMLHFELVENLSEIS